MFWDILRYGIAIGLWIWAGWIMWHEKPWQAQTVQEEPIGPLVDPTPDAFPLHYHSPYIGDKN